jgi:hypothetical protein
MSEEEEGATVTRRTTVLRSATDRQTQTETRLFLKEGEKQQRRPPKDQHSGSLRLSANVLAENGRKSLVYFS